jgi:hypothetical protein
MWNLQESSGLSFPRVIELITLGNKSLLLSSGFCKYRLAEEVGPRDWEHQHYINDIAGRQ